MSAHCSRLVGHEREGTAEEREAQDHGQKAAMLGVICFVLAA